MCRRGDRLRICAGPIVIAVTDVLMTLHGQPVDYWVGTYSAVREDNPLARILLTMHPAAFLAGNLAWIFCIVLGMLLLPFGTARCLAIVVLLWQAVGVSSWLLRLPWGFLWVVLLLLLVRVVVDKTMYSRTISTHNP
jgi:hypothetical protein